MSFSNIENTQLPICKEAREILSEFLDKEKKYIYSSKEIRKLFTFEKKEEFIHSTLSLEEFIKIHKLREIYNEKYPNQYTTKSKKKHGNNQNQNQNQTNTYISSSKENVIESIQSGDSNEFPSIEDIEYYSEPEEYELNSHDFDMDSDDGYI
jgi:hypothetical protein